MILHLNWSFPPVLGGVSTQGGVCPGGCLLGGCLPRGVCPGGCLPRGVCLGVSAQGVCLLGGCVSAGGVCVCLGGCLPRGGVYLGGCTMWPIPWCIWCYLYAASTPTETQHQCSCLYSAGPLHDGIHTPPPCGQNDTHLWKYYLAPNFVCGR